MECTIDCDEPLEIYNDFTLLIKKVDSDSKSYSYENIYCVLKYGVHGDVKMKIYELDSRNFSWYYMMVEKFKSKRCHGMGVPVELVISNTDNPVEDITPENADDQLRKSFGKFLEDSGIIETLFKFYLRGINDERSKATK